MSNKTTWHYSTISPKHTLTEPFNHEVGYKVKRNILDSKNRRFFQPYCTCGWRHGSWVQGRQYAAVVHARHLAQAEGQGSLFGRTPLELFKTLEDDSNGAV